ncbi:glutamine cyclotransferase [Bacteroidia bacterium]|nr:glutamine cyclotransferase [Bacteroidia bacterium]
MKNLVFVGFILLFGCAGKPHSQLSASSEQSEALRVPAFNADSAYAYTAAQVAFGPRVPATAAHQRCGDYFVAAMRRLGATITQQEATVTTYDRQTIPLRNIIAAFQPDKPTRVLLCAHWDSRPFADRDANPQNHRRAIDGANDGAGACGVLLEIARQIALQAPNVGIDIIFFDAEDWGQPAFDTRRSGDSGYCLGSTYWANHPHTPNYKAQYGILLDMVSARGARFFKEQSSVYYANNIVKKVWETAQSLGYGDYFVEQTGIGCDDDHIPINQIRKIPCIDIIENDPNAPKGFGDYWHTLDDTMDAVSRETMKAVGQTLLQIIYNS